MKYPSKVSSSLSIPISAGYISKSLLLNLIEKFFFDDVEVSTYVTSISRT
jgi:hypothetical protein